MRHQIPGLHSRHQDSETGFDGVFLVRVERAWYRWHPQKTFVELRFFILEPQSFQDRSFFSRLYCTERAFVAYLDAIGERVQEAKRGMECPT